MNISCVMANKDILLERIQNPDVARVVDFVVRKSSNMFGDPNGYVAYPNLDSAMKSILIELGVFLSGHHVRVSYDRNQKNIRRASYNLHFDNGTEINSVFVLKEHQGEMYIL